MKSKNLFCFGSCFGKQGKLHAQLCGQNVADNSDDVKQIADRKALDCIKSNQDAYVLWMHSACGKDGEVVGMLERYGLDFFRKEVRLTFNGCVNLKKLSGGSFSFLCAETRPSRKSIAGTVLQVFVFVCSGAEKTDKVKSVMSELTGMGNPMVHISGCREEAVRLAEIFFNSNTLELINRRPFDYEDPDFDVKVRRLIRLISERHLDRDDFCCLATTVFGIRKSGDLDCFYLGNGKIDFFSDDISDNAGEFPYYPFPPREILDDPKLHCYYCGLKFVALDVLLEIKRKRGKPRDKETCKMIECFKKGRKYRRWHFRIYEKRKDGDRRTAILLGFIKINYRRRRS